MTPVIAPGIRAVTLNHEIISSHAFAGNCGGDVPGSSCISGKSGASSIFQALKL